VSDLFFLPAWPLPLQALPWYALLLLAAAIAGEALQRLLRLPRVLGWIVAGVVLGPHASGALGAQDLAGLRGVLEVAIGMVLFELGQRVDLQWLRRNPWLLAASLLECGLSFGAMFVLLLALDAPPLLAAVAAAIGVATAPAVILVVVRDLRAQGQVTERALLLTALNNIVAFLSVSMLLAWLAHEYAGGWRIALGHPLYLITGSLALAGALAGVTLALLQLLGRRDEAQFISAVALVVLAVWAAGALKLSVTLTLLGYGTLLRAIDRRRHFVSLDFGRVGRIFVMLLFAITAASLDLRLLPAGALAGATLVAARYLGKTLGIFAFARPSGMTLRKASLVSLGLMPMSGLAVVLVSQTAELYPKIGVSLATVVVSATVMLELLGPLVAHFALIKAGDAAEDAGR